MTSHAVDEQRLRRLLAEGRSLVSELDSEAVLARVLDVARELTGARYAAVGVLDERRREFERFVWRGIDDATYQTMGELPRGRGILGLLIETPEPLRLLDLRAHPRSYGFPANHPPMSSFLGVPILIRGEPWGNIYLTEKEGGAFDAADEEALVVLAEWAAVAIENAGLYRRLRERRDELERNVQGLEATSAIARAIGTETQLDRVLELIVKRGRALVGARAMVILLNEGADLVAAACAGEMQAGVLGTRFPIEGSASGEILRRGRPERITNVAQRLRRAAGRLGVGHAKAALVVPLVFRSQPLGVLIAFDRLGKGDDFDDEQEALLLAFAASAATAVATAQSVEEQRLRQSMGAAEQERRRWARELHDETLQGLGGLQVLLSSALRLGSPERLELAVTDAVDQIGTEIEKLRMLITELRPAALDELGLQPAIESLVGRVAAVQGLVIEARIDIGDPRANGRARFDAEVETAVYRLVQEALANVVKHARADRVEVEIASDDEQVRVVVRDDGIGFDPAQPREGFGITGMRERVELTGGELQITRAPEGGTVVRAWLGVRRPLPRVWAGS